MNPDPRGIVTNIQHFSIHDGPGIRTTVFLKGCPLQCVWCHNPECIGFKPEILYHEEFCIGCGECVQACPYACHMMENGKKVFNRTCCNLLGLCLERCWAEALELKGKELSVPEVLDEVAEDRPFYDKTSGGLTVSGGEPLAQPEFTLALLEGAKTRNLHTVVDTSGFGSWHTLERMLPLTDLFLYDFKCFDAQRHKQLTGVDNALIISNLEKLLEHGAKTIIRIPLIKDCNDQLEEMEAAAKMFSEWDYGLQVDLLPYHPYGKEKYKRLGLDFKLIGGDAPSIERLSELRRVLRRKGLNVRIKGMEKSEAR